MTKARRNATTLLAHDGPCLESTQGRNRPQGTTPPQNAGKRRIRHRPLSKATEPLLAACRVRYDQMGLSPSDVAEATGLDKSDIAKALNLRAEPTARTLGGLCDYFGVASVKELAAAERKRALLLSIDSKLDQLKDLFGAFLGEIEEDV